MGVSGTNIGHSETDFVGIRWVSETRYCENMRALPMDGRVWLATGGEEREKMKMIVSGTAKRKREKSAFQLKMVLLWNEIFLSFVKMICSGTEI